MVGGVGGCHNMFLNLHVHQWMDKEMKYYSTIKEENSAILDKIDGPEYCVKRNESYRGDKYCITFLKC